MKASKKVLTLFLAAAMVVGAFAGCSKAGDESSTANESSQSSQSGESSTEPSGNTGEVTTLDYYISTTAVSGPVTGWLGDYLKENGLALNIIAGSEEKMQAYLAGGDLPDLMSFDKWDSVTKAIAGKMLVNLDEHLDKLPNVTANVPEAIEYTRDNRSNGTGNLYVIPSSIGDSYFPVDTGVYSINVRWDIYEKIGCPEAETLEDLIPIFKQMQEAYPETEDGTKTYAMNLFSSWDGTTKMSAVNNVITTLGYMESFYQYFADLNLETGEINSIFDDDSTYLRALKFFYQLNQEGLLDPDAITQTYEAAKAKVDSGAYVAIGYAGYKDGFNTPEHVDADEPVGYMPIIFDEYKACVIGDATVGSTRNQLGISAVSSKLDACLQYINLTADYDALLTLNNGPQGELWDINDDGEVYATEKYWECYNSNGGKLTLSNGEELHPINYEYVIANTQAHPTYNVPLGIGNWPDVIEGTQKNKLTEAWSAQNDGYMFPIQKMEAEGRVYKCPLASTLMETTPDDIALLQQAIAQIVIQNSWKMAYAKDEAEFNSLWDDMKTQAEALDVQEVIDWATDAWNKGMEIAKQYVD